MSPPPAAAREAATGVSEPARPSSRRDASIYCTLPNPGTGGIFPEPHHGLLFLGEVVHLRLQVPFALLPWQLLDLVLDLWGGRRDFPAGN